MKSDSMNERATKLLRMAEQMDKRVIFYEFWIKATTSEDGNVFRLIHALDTKKRASRRLWAAYINELTKIKLGIW